MYGPICAAKINPAAPARLARFRINLTYLWSHGRLPDLAAPRRFTELVQARKLHDRNPLQHVWLDKLAAKAMARGTLGEAWTTPTCWSGVQLPDAPPFRFPAILKARHGCNQYAVLRQYPGDARWRKLQRTAQRWVRGLYGGWLDEWAYRAIAPGMIAEPLLGNGRDLPIDYKIYVFGGTATHVQVHLGRGHRHRWILHDRDWRQLVPAADRPAPPRALVGMLEAAEVLAGGTDFLRVDFYEIDGKPRFGEFCVYPGSGLDPFAADWIDVELGLLWHQATQSLKSGARAGAERMERGAGNCGGAFLGSFGAH